MFKTKTVLEIRKLLIARFDSLASESQDYVRQNIKNYRRVSFENLTVKKEPFHVDMEACITFIKKADEDIYDLEFPSQVCNGNFRQNDIYYPFVHRFPDEPEWNSLAHEVYRSWRDALQYKCKEEFFQIQSVTDTFIRLCPSNIFNDVVIEKKKASFYNNGFTFLIDKSIWERFVHSLFVECFDEFPYNDEHSTKTIARYLKRLSNGFLFGFEYSKTDLAKETARGIPTLPLVINLIVCKDFFKKSKICDLGQDMINLGTLGNPFFFPPCYPLQGFCAVDIFMQNERGNPYLTRFLEVDDNHLQIIHPRAFGESVTKHAFFYIELLARTSKSYTEYLAKVLEEALP